MFGGDGKPHRGRHEGQTEECTCRDRWEEVQEVAKAGYPLDPLDVEPEKTPFPLLGIDDSPAETVEEWAVFLWRDVRQGVGSNGFGHASITWGDLADYERFMGVPLSDFRVRLILTVDQSFLAHYRPSEQPEGGQIGHSKRRH